MYFTGVKAETPSSQEPKSYGENSYWVASFGGVHWSSEATTPTAVMIGKGTLKLVKLSKVARLDMYVFTPPKLPSRSWYDRRRPQGSIIVVGKPAPSLRAISVAIAPY